MPVIKKGEDEVAYALLKGNIKKRMEAMQITNKQMSAYVGLAETTYEKKVRHPERFTYPEMRRLCKRLKLTDDEILEAFR